MLSFLQSRLSGPWTLRPAPPPSHDGPAIRPLPGATRLEDLPAEVLLLVGETINRDNVDTPAANPVEVVGRQNSRLASIFRAPMAAADLTLPLWTAETPRELTIALRELANAPPDQRAWCWDSVLPAIERSATNRPACDLEAWLNALRRNLPDDPAIRLRLLRQAADVLLRAPRGFAGALSPLLAACADEPHLPDALWLQMLRLVVKDSPYFLNRPSMQEAAASVQSPTRRAELDLAIDIVRMDGFPGNVPTLEGLLQRLLALRPGPPFGLLCDELISRWHANALRYYGSHDHAAGVLAIRQALLSAAEKPAYRDDALARLPVCADTPPEVRAALARHVDTLRPAAAMQLLTRQMRAFITHPFHLPRQCAEVLARARTSPAEHVATTLALARVHGMIGFEPPLLPAASPLDTREQAVELARLVLAEVPRLPLAQRLQVLVAIEPRDRIDLDWPKDWERAWQQFLQAICQGALQGGLDMTRRDAIRALAAALPYEQRRGRVPQPRPGDDEPLPEARSGPLLQALSRLLGALPPNELAAALLEIQPLRPRFAEPAAPSRALLQLLVRCCERLPVELRRGPLEALDIATRRLSGSVREPLEILFGDTRQAAFAWRAISRDKVRARRAAQH